MLTLKELLKHTQPEAIDKMQDVAESSFADKFAKNPTALTSEQVDALNDSPDILNRINSTRAKMAANASPAASVSAPEVPASSFSPSANISPEVEAMSAAKPVVAAEEASSGMSGLMSKLSGLSEEALSKLGPIGKKIMESRAATMIENAASSPAGKLIGKALPLGAAALETKNALQNVADGKYLDASMNAAGAGAGIAHYAGAAAAGPLAAVAGGYGAGKLYREIAGMGDDLPPPSPQDPNAPVTTPPVVAPNQYGPSPLPPTLAAKPSVERDEEDDSGNKVAPKGGKQTVSHASSSDTRLAATGSAEQQAIQNLVNSPGFSNNTVENLKAVQDAANKQKNVADMMKAVNQISSGLTGAAFHTGAPSTAAADKFQDDQKAEADNSIKQFQDLTEKEKDDPNSSYSASMRAFAKPLMAKLNIKLPDNMSATQMATVSPMLVKMFDAKQTDETNRLKIQELNLKRQELLDARKEKGEEKADLTKNKLAMALNADLDANKARGGNLAKSQAVVNAAERLDGLFDQFPDGNIPKGQTTELATAVASMISGGSPQSQHQIDQMVPDTMRGKAADIASWVTGNPEGREQQNFIKLLKDTSAREKAIAQDQVARAQVQRLNAHEKLQQMDSQLFDKIIRGYGVDPEKYRSGGYGKKGTKGATQGGHQPGDVINYKGKQYRIGQDGDSLEPL